MLFCKVNAILQGQRYSARSTLAWTLSKSGSRTKHNNKLWLSIRSNKFEKVNVNKIRSVIIHALIVGCCLVGAKVTAGDLNHLMEIALNIAPCDTASDSLRTHYNLCSVISSAVVASQPVTTHSTATTATHQIAIMTLFWKILR